MAFRYPAGKKGQMVLFTDGRYTCENPINLASRLFPVALLSFPLGDASIRRPCC
ncbi:MAG: hypothetical protein FWC43_09260 [Planctomycetaceae bacterium]|nr:hypothetical protein [Planctomycetaceae bacterium]